MGFNIGVCAVQAQELSSTSRHPKACCSESRTSTHVMTPSAKRARSPPSLHLRHCSFLLVRAAASFARLLMDNTLLNNTTRSNTFIDFPKSEGRQQV
jgi:hypothetical protein